MPVITRQAQVELLSVDSSVAEIQQFLEGSKFKFSPADPNSTTLVGFLDEDQVFGTSRSMVRYGGFFVKVGGVFWGKPVSAHALQQVGLTI